MGTLQVAPWLSLAAAFVFAKGSDDGRTFSTDPCLGPECLPPSGVTTHIGLASERISAYRDAYTDPLWPDQWYVHDYRVVSGPVMDLNVVPAHRMGYTGHGTNVAVVDTGVDTRHPDLVDLLLLGRPKSGGKLAGEHGTQAAGLIKMAPNNTHCGVGLAYGANIIDINTGGLTETDNRLAHILTKRLDSVDIYSNSWGPKDDGESMEFRRLALNAIKIGATKGRKGKGSIYVFAGGNGKEMGDNCGADDLLNSVYTIGVAGATRGGKATRYGERCSALMATAYSGGDGAAGGLVTTTLAGGCSTTFAGTSAAAPVASAIVALTLQANPEITYRDVMHIITMSAEVAPLSDNGNTWNQNGQGFWVSNDFGFGLLNAKNMVQMAETWNNIPPLRNCTVVVNFEAPRVLTVGNAMDAYLVNDACVNDPDHKIGALEQFQLSLKLKYSYRGALEVSVTTAKETKITLMEARERDRKSSGFGSNWVFKSVHAWGEDPYGKWVIGVKVVLCDNISSCTNVKKRYGLSSFLNQLNEISPNCVRGGLNKLWTGYTLRLFGTQQKPSHAESWPRTYSAFRLPDNRTGRTTKLVRFRPADV